MAASAPLYYAPLDAPPDQSKWRGRPAPPALGWAPTPLPHGDDDIAPGFHAPVEIRPSAHGRGLFALVDIPKGTLLWKLKACRFPSREGNVWAFSSEAEIRARIEPLKDEVASLILDHIFMSDGTLYEILDEGDVWNHSDTETTTGYPPAGDGYCNNSSYSVRDIRAGEELLDNYSLYEYPDWYEAIKAKYNVHWDFVQNKKAVCPGPHLVGGAGHAP